MTKVRKAVIAAAGFGTRFLPQTKAMPKEMLPLVDKPIIQYIVEELVEAGIEDIVIVSNSTKRAIEDHFDYPNEDLVANLTAGGPSKKHFPDEVHAVADLANFVYIRQKGPYGNATPLLNAAHLIGDEPFIYAYADDLITAYPNRFSQMIDRYKQYGGSIMPCIRLTKDEEYKRYGVVGGDNIADGVIRMSHIVEKPGKDKAPSNLASVGAYLLTPDAISYLQSGSEKIDAGDEFYLTSYVLEPMIADGKKLFACELSESKYHDAGNKLEYLKTVVDFALQRDDIKDDFLAYLRTVVKD